ncbi:hypothetical protein HDE_12654 [Halotydeus destructor]|nr:hypothetical protein HDE_12654 [Halotydeus destructor]
MLLDQDSLEEKSLSLPNLFTSQDSASTQTVAANILASQDRQQAVEVSVDVVVERQEDTCETDSTVAYSPVSRAPPVSSTKAVKKRGRKRKQDDDDYVNVNQKFKKTKNAAAAARYRAKKADEFDHWQHELDVHMQQHETLVKEYNGLLTKRNILLELNFEKHSKQNVLFPDWVHRMFSKN